MEKLNDFHSVVNSFPWQSDVQHEGILNLYQFLVERAFFASTSFDYKLICICAYFIQKDHEANEYWREMVGNQISSLEDQIRGLQEQLNKVLTEN